MPDPIPLQTDPFDDFWCLYPRHEAKKDARKAWAQIPPSQHLAILLAIAAWRPVLIARGDTQFRPLPATWLRGERWEDDLPAGSQPTPAAHAPALMPIAGPREPMPEHVQQMLKRLRRA